MDRHPYLPNTTQLCPGMDLAEYVLSTTSICWRIFPLQCRVSSTEMASYRGGSIVM